MLTTLLCLLPLTAWGSGADDDLLWPEYRGPGHDGDAGQTRLPLTWSEDEHVRWKTPIHGRGWSSPVIGGGRIWLTTAPPGGEALSVLAVDLETGAIVLDRVVLEVEEPEHRNALNSYASPSPVLDAERVYVHFGTYGTLALDAQSGETLWERRDLHCDHMEGPGSSPFLYADKLYVHMDGGDVQYLVALDTATGTTVWRRERSVDLSEVPKDMRKAYSTPVIAEVGGEPHLVSSAARATYGYHPDTGEELWRIDHPGFSMSSRPLVGDGLVYVSTGFMRAEFWALRPGAGPGEGDGDGERVAWRCKRSIPTMPSPVLVEGRIFLVDDGGIASCLDAVTGEVLWRERLNAGHCASLLHAGGRLYAFDREGVTTVLAAGPEFRKLAESRLESGFMASPAVAGVALIVRTEKHLYRLEE